MTDEQIKRLLALGNEWRTPTRHRAAIQGGHQYA
jgi:hypothetical protein